MNSLSAAFNRLVERCISSRGPAMFWMQRVCVGLCFSVLASSIFAQTQIGGAITTNTLWRAAQGPYIASADVLVQNGAALTIEPGTTIYMGPGTSLIMQSGTLTAIGTAQAPIKFTSQKVRDNQIPASGDWEKLTFGADINSATRLEYVQIEYGKGIAVNGAAPTFNYLTIKNNQGAAIAVDLTASPVGAGNQAIGNDINAILVPAGDINGSVTWGLRGIPYVVPSGAISIGASPKIISVSPNSLQQGETQILTLTGFRLTGLSEPLFDLPGLSGKILPGATDSQAQLELTATLDTAIGNANILIQTDSGEFKLTNAVTIVATQPKLTSVTPSTLSIGQGDTAVSLKGKNFTNQSVAFLDGVAIATTYISSTELSAVIPNQTANATKTIKLRTPSTSGGGAEFVSNELAVAIITPVPVVSTVAPDSLRRGETKAFQVTGSGLNTTTLTSSDPTLTISAVVLSPTQANFNLTAATNATLGKQQVRLANSAGTASATVTVNPALPTAKVAPTPIAVPPDNSSRQYAIQLSYADTIDHTFTVAIADKTLATTSLTSLTIAAGQVQVVGSITGLKAGTTSMTLTSSTLGTLSVPVYVTSEYVGLNTGYAPMLGVVLTPPSVPPAQQSVMPVSKHLGVVFGNAVQDVSPKAFSIGSGPNTLTISGNGLQGATSVTVKPADGVTVGAISVAPDGKSIVVPLTVAADAPTTRRQIIVMSSAGTAYPAAKPDADRIAITPPMPEIYSVDPLFGTPGTTSLSLVIRGRNLQSIQSIGVTPADGITLDSAPVVNADGTQVTAMMAIAQSAPHGDRVITVTTPAGTSDASANASNVFKVVTQVVNSVTPIASPNLGIVKQDAAPPASQTQGLFTRAVGVTFGTTAVSINPRAKAVGETFTLTVQGVGLESVNSISFVPNTGLTVGTPNIAADGRSVSVDVSIAADAPQTIRMLKLSAGTVAVPFATAAGATFNVTAVVPSIDSTDPIVLQVGAAPVAMTIRGKNFQNAQGVRFVPPDGMTVSVPPTVDATGTQLSVNVSAAAGAMLGNRAVVVTTPGGESSPDMTAANTVSLANSMSTTGPIASPLVGIVKQETVAATSTTYGPVAAANIGVVYGQITTQPASSSAFASPLGVVVGAAASDVQPKNVVIGSSAVLTINGIALDNVNAVSVNPAQGVTIGSPLQLSADGSQVTVPIAIATDAAPTIRTVTVSGPAGAILFRNPAGSTFGIYPDMVPQFSSISPILSTQGSLVTLTIVGQNFQNAKAVVAQPADGITFDTQPTVNADGTQLTIRIQIAADASLGTRVIQVLTPTSASSADPSPANKFTVYAP